MRRFRVVLLLVAGFALVAAACSSGAQDALDEPETVSQPSVEPLADASGLTPNPSPESADEDPTGVPAAPEGLDITSPSATPTAPSEATTFLADYDPDDWIVNDQLADIYEAGTFRITCRVSHYAADDPIAFPGEHEVSDLHMFFGNTETNADSTFGSLFTTGGGSCLGGPINRSAYWAPAMLDGNGEIVEPETVTVFYKAPASADGAVTQIPSGLTAVAGAPDTFTRGGAPWRWSCRDQGNDSTTIPTCARGIDVVVQMFFPHCWDGVNLDAPDHRSHLVYDVRDSTSCPASHPVLLPVVSYQLFWPSDGDTSSWRLSSDPAESADGTGGASFHAEFISAWNPEIATTWHKGCLIDERDCSWGDLGDRHRLVGDSLPNSDS